MNTLSHIFNNSNDEDDSAALETQPVSIPPITELTGAMPKTPYPARRKYSWADQDTVLGYVEAINLFVRMRKQSPPKKNPERFRALTLAAESVEHLHRVKGITTFPGPRLHKLLCKAALAADWCPDINAVLRRTATVVLDESGNVPAEGATIRLRCPSCGEAYPMSAFMAPMTYAQRVKWRVSEDSTRKVKTRSCTKCRANRAQRLTNSAKAKDVRRMRTEYTRAVINNNLEIARKLFGGYWENVLSRLIRSLATTITSTTHEPTREFMQLRMECLTNAVEQLQAAVECGAIDQYLFTGADWTMFLSAVDRRKLVDAHAKAVFLRKENGIRTRHPTL